MYCPRCGDTNYDSDRFCSSCGQDLATYRQVWGGTTPSPASSPVAQHPSAPPAPSFQVTLPAHGASPAPAAVARVAGLAEPVAETPRVPDYSTWAAALLALCWPAFWAAIPALVCARRAESRLAAGDIEGARRASRRARDLCWVTFVAGSALWIVALALIATLWD